MLARPLAIAAMRPGVKSPGRIYIGDAIVRAWQPGEGAVGEKAETALGAGVLLTDKHHADGVFGSLLSGPRRTNSGMSGISQEAGSFASPWAPFKRSSSTLSSSRSA